MKKLILTTIAMGAAVSVFAQGTVVFNNFVLNTVQTHIYAPNATTPTISLIGNSTAGGTTGDFPVGTVDWTGYTRIGANGNTGPYGGATTFAQLLGAPGLSQAESSLQPAFSGGITSFRSGGGAGLLFGTTPTFNNIPQNSNGGATFEFVAWDNSSAQYPTWAAASVAWRAGLIAAGSSGLFNITAQIGGTVTPPNLTPLQSFNLYMIPVPEPSSFALAGLGAAALLIFRRRK